MRSITPFAAAAVVAVVQIACSDPAPPTAPMSPSAADNVTQSEPSGDGSTVRVRMLDNCDPASFNEAVGPGTCIPRHGTRTPFSSFVAQLTAKQTALGWNFSPEKLNVSKGTTLLVVNEGGEVHSFTEVKEFGGGVLEFLNKLTGTPNVAPECAAAPPSEFKAPGEVDREVENETGVKLYECCIHPWMRAIVHVHGT